MRHLVIGADIKMRGYAGLEGVSLVALVKSEGKVKLRFTQKGNKLRALLLLAGRTRRKSYPWTHFLHLLPQQDNSARTVILTSSRTQGGEFEKRPEANVNKIALGTLFKQPSGVTNDCLVGRWNMGVASRVGGIWRQAS